MSWLGFTDPCQDIYRKGTWLWVENPYTYNSKVSDCLLTSELDRDMSALDFCVSSRKNSK